MALKDAPLKASIFGITWKYDDDRYVMYGSRSRIRGSLCIFVAVLAP